MNYAFGYRHKKVSLGQIIFLLCAYAAEQTATILMFAPGKNKCG